MSDDDYRRIIREMEKAHKAEQLKVAKKVNQMAITMNIKVSKPIIYGVPITLDFGTPCDFDRGSWRSKVYHVVFGDRGVARTLCGRQICRSRLWVAYLGSGSDKEPPRGRRVCKKCAEHEDYILHQLALA